jgi:phosphodiester glycosidase
MARGEYRESFLARMKTLAFAFALLVALPVAAAAGELPSNIAPGAPFPRILEQAPTIEWIAPGIEYGEYQLYTGAGPLSIHVVAVEPHREDVHVASVLANNVLESKGETVGSMAKRTGAVAGINGDYFDIGNTNRPLNIVVRNGQLLQMPRKRYALAVTRDGSASIDEFGFLGQVQLGDKTISLDSIDQVPAPNGGTAFLTPEFGSVPPQDNTTLVGLQLLDGTPPLARYRVTSIADNLSAQPPGYYLAIGPGAYNAVDPPNPGDMATVSGDLSPVGLDQLTTAIGGGPLILHNGAWFEDPDGPNGGEFSKRIPSSGAAIAPDGTLFLIEVDGRQPSVSVGLTRREFAALMRALGATQGLAFDGGGSSTMVVRRLGDEESSIANEPSDGKERPVGDALLVYSTAPVGAAVRLVARPGVIRAVTGADVSLRIAAVDSANHVASTQERLDAKVEPASLGIFRNGRFTALHPGLGNIVLRSGRLSGDVSIEVLSTPAKTTIVPANPNVEKGGTIALAARALDARGYHLSLPPLLPWETKNGYVDAHGVYRAGSRNSTVTVRIGASVAGTLVTVGSHEAALAFADRARFVTMPHGGSGSLNRDPSCGSCLALSYAFSGNERAAYAMADLPLPLHTIGLSFDVLDDGSGSRLRVALRNSINEDAFLDATPLDAPGWRHVTVRWSGETAEAARLLGIYVLPPKGMELSTGRIVIRNVRAVIAGQ